jgi:type I restriction enzyme S subunit
LLVEGYENKSIRYIDIGSVGTGRLVKEPSKYRLGDAPSRARQKVKTDDIIISTVRTYLRAIFQITSSTEDCIVSTGFAVLRAKPEINARWLLYALGSSDFLDQVTRNSTGMSYPAISSSKLMSLPIAVPPIEDQAAIASFLDNAELRIARAIKAKLQLANVLRERRRVIVEEHILRGISDPNAGPLIDSGIPWLGQIPSTWTLTPFRGIFQSKRETVGSRSHEFTLLSLTLNGVIIRDLSQMKGKFPASFDTYQIVKPGQLIMCLFDVDETPRTVGISQHQGMITGAYDVFQAKDELLAKFAELQLLTIDSGKKFKPLYRGLRKVVPTNALSGARLAVPPADQIPGIIAAVNSATAETDRALQALEQEIALLREYRTRLVSDVVTGKRDVRAEARGLQEVSAGELESVLGMEANSVNDDLEGVDDDN